jgi:conjugative transfer signal peptidase TraF
VSWLRFLSIVAIGFGLAVGVLGLTLHSLGARIAVGGSLPSGLYLPASGAVRRGDIAEACLPAAIAAYAREHELLWAGDCPNGEAPVLKIVAAVAGDEVVVTAAGIRVNDRLFPMSAARSTGDRMRVPKGSYRVLAGRVWLLGWHPRSWDSRYYGPIPVSALRGRVTPTFTDAGYLWRPAL